MNPAVPRGTSDVILFVVDSGSSTANTINIQHTRDLRMTPPDVDETPYSLQRIKPGEILLLTAN